jgi:hypothetical protein
MSIRSELNNQSLGRLCANLQELQLGELLNLALAGVAYNEVASPGVGLTVTNNVATLGTKPTQILMANAMTVSGGSATGIKNVLYGPVTGTAAVVPASGQCVWDGNVSVLFAASDLVATAEFATSLSATVTSAMQRVVGQNP